MEQHMQALEQANRVRFARADLKRRVGTGEVSVEAVLDPDAAIPMEAESMGIGLLLAAQKRWGAKRAGTFLRPLGIGERREVGKLTRRQRERLILALRGVSVRDERILSSRLHLAA